MGKFYEHVLFPLGPVLLILIITYYEKKLFKKSIIQASFNEFSITSFVVTKSETNSY